MMRIKVAHAPLTVERAVRGLEMLQIGLGMMRIGADLMRTSLDSQQNRGELQQRELDSHHSGVERLALAATAQREERRR